MKNTILLKTFCFFCVLFYFNSSIAADTLKVSIPKMPVHSVSEHKGVLVEFARALASKTGKSVDVQLVPFSRSIYYVGTNKVDFHLPLIKPNENFSTNDVSINNSVVKLGEHSSNTQRYNFIYSDETIFYVNFVLYSHKDNVIDLTKLPSYKIETDSAHLPFLRDIKMGSDCIFCSLKKVQHKMTDGYIFADSSTDPFLRENKELLSSVRRQLYQRFEVKVLFPNTEKGQQLNKTMSAVITKMRLSGELDKLLSSVNFSYDDWQLKTR